MLKKANHLYLPKLLILICGFSLLTLILVACSTTKPANVANYRDMDCEQLYAEMDKLNNEIAKTQNNKEMGRAVDTGASVAVQGASLAGVPYIGAIFSIGKTLVNHSKQTSVNNTSQTQENLYSVESVAYDKGCL